jgi:hypothetical protein
MLLLIISISSGEFVGLFFLLPTPSFVCIRADQMTFFRCCHVLPDATILWTDAAEEDGVGNAVNKVAPLENACAAISCSGVTQCNTLDNGGF